MEYTTYISNPKTPCVQKRSGQELKEGQDKKS